MIEQKLKEEKKEEYNEERKRKELEKRNKEEKEKIIEKVSKVEVTVKSTIQKVTEAKAKVPILKLERPKIEVKEAMLLKEIPHIEKEEVKVKIPIIKLPSPVFEERKIKLDKNIPLIVGSSEERIRMPIIKLRKVHVKSIISELNSTIIEPPRKPQPRVRVPIYRILRTPKIREIALLDDKIDEKLLERLEGRRIETEEHRVSVASKPAEPSISEGEKIEEKPPEVIEFVFGRDFKKILAGGPIVILYKELESDSTIGSFETLCIRIFREKRGGYPEIQPIKKLDEFNIKEIEKWIKAEGKIVRIDLDSLKRDAERKEKNIFEVISSERLKETIDRFVVGDISFLIFKMRDEKLYTHCKQVLSEVMKYMEHLPIYVEITPRELTFEQKRILTELAWGVSVKGVGIVIKDSEGERPLGDTLDDMFNKFGQKIHDEYLRNLQEENYGLYWDATKPHEGEESDLHRQIKTFIVKLLAKKYNLKAKEEIKEKVLTEKEIDDIKPDIYDKIEEVVYEVETLFSEDNEGKIPRDKLNKTIEKYEETTIRKINIVLDNLTLLLHLRDIFGIKKNIKDWEKKNDKTVNFLTLDIENCKLVPISKIFRKCKSLNKSR